MNNNEFNYLYLKSNDGNNYLKVKENHDIKECYLKDILNKSKNIKLLTFDKLIYGHFSVISNKDDKSEIAEFTEPIDIVFKKTFRKFNKDYFYRSKIISHNVKNGEKEFFLVCNKKEIGRRNNKLIREFKLKELNSNYGHTFKFMIQVYLKEYFSDIFDSTFRDSEKINIFYIGDVDYTLLFLKRILNTNNNYAYFPVKTDFIRVPVDINEYRKKLFNYEELENELEYITSKEYKNHFIQKKFK